MNRKVYKCQVCGGMVETWNRKGDGLSCCGAPLTFCAESRPPARREDESPLIDLTEVVVNGKSRWQCFPPGRPPRAWARPGGAGRRA